MSDSWSGCDYRPWACWWNFGLRIFFAQNSDQSLKQRLNYPCVSAMLLGGYPRQCQDCFSNSTLRNSVSASWINLNSTCYQWSTSQMGPPHSFKRCFPSLYDVKSHSDFTNHSVSITDTGTTRIHYTLFQNLHLSYLESGKIILISKCGTGRLPNSL